MGGCIMSFDQNREELRVVVDAPYPPVQAAGRHPEYGRAMLSNIGSDHSEMGTVSQYFYNSVILKPEHEAIARCFHQISVVEMHHLNIFASLAFQLGMDPRLWCVRSGGRSYWSPAYNHYPRELRRILENAVQDEQAAVRKYRRQAETIRDPNIVDNLNRIILDEERHIELFQTMLRRLKEQPGG